MKKNKYLVFLSIGFELIVLILLAVWLGEYLVANGYPKSSPAFSVVAAFFIWFTSLVFKLKNLEK